MYNDKIINLTRSIEKHGQKSKLRNMCITMNNINNILSKIHLKGTTFHHGFHHNDHINLTLYVSSKVRTNPYILLWLIELPISIHANTAMHTLSSLG